MTHLCFIFTSDRPIFRQILDTGNTQLPENNIKDSILILIFEFFLVVRKSRFLIVDKTVKVVEIFQKPLFVKKKCRSIREISKNSKLIKSYLFVP